MRSTRPTSSAPSSPRSGGSSPRHSPPPLALAEAATRTPPIGLSGRKSPKRVTGKQAGRSAMDSAAQQINVPVAAHAPFRPDVLVTSRPIAAATGTLKSKALATPTVKQEPGHDTGMRAPQYALVRTGPDTEVFVEVNGVHIDLTDPEREVERLQLNWEKPAFESRGDMAYMKELDAVCFRRDPQAPMQVAPAWADPEDPRKVDPAIHFEQPWLDPEGELDALEHFHVRPEHAHLTETPAGRDQLREQLTREALADLQATAQGRPAPSASKSGVDLLQAQDVGAGEEILLKKNRAGSLRASTWATRSNSLASTPWPT